MKTWKILKTKEDFREAEAALKALEDKADKTQNEMDEEEMLGALIDAYHKKYDVNEGQDQQDDLPDPIAAIELRMDQDGLTRKDLRQWIGSASKVSEVMNRKVSLSLSMIRNLHEGLCIPLEVLLQDTTKKLSDNPHLPEKYPFAEMLKRGYFNFTGTLAAAKALGEELLNSFFSAMPQFVLKTCFRQTQDAVVDENAVRAWQCRVFQRASQTELPEYDASRINDDFYKDVAKLSQYLHGPQIAMEKLHNAGIHLIFESHLPKTRIDGAAFMLPNGHPVIGMTLRYDRLDNFWFTLMHELHHVMKDISPDKMTAFLDDTKTILDDSKDEMEQQADKAAADALIPPEVWKDAKVQALLHTSDSDIVRKVAQEKQLSPAVLAGRLHWETGKYDRFQNLLGKCRDELLETTTNADETE